MPQMYPMSWLLVFLSVEFMLVFSLFLMSMMILEIEFSEKISEGKLSSGLIWLW